jgi:hypothetical protein
MTRIDSNKLARIFISTAGAVLLASALGMFISCGSSDRSILPRDPLFLLPLPTFCWIVGGMEFAVAAYCLFGKSTALRTGLVLWLALNCLIYRAGMYYGGVTGGLNGYTGIISDAFGISRSVANGLVGITVGYLIFGSVFFMAWSWWRGRQERLHPSVKIFCWSCGIHIKFPVQELGRIVLCPNCKQAVTLRKPENLKMSCGFCQEHIEFPYYAIGKKMPCPHCAKTITLLNPA